MRRDDVAVLYVANHEAGAAFGDMDGHEWAQACIQPVLVGFVRFFLAADSVNPRRSVR